MKVQHCTYDDPTACVDDLAVKDAQMVHLEMLDTHSAYLALHGADGTLVQVEIQAHKRHGLRLVVSHDDTHSEVVTG